MILYLTKKLQWNRTFIVFVIKKKEELFWKEINMEEIRICDTYIFAIFLSYFWFY